jgi:glutaconate CoA-transferase subunit A
VRGFDGSDIPERSGIHTIEDPYTGETLFAIPKLQPDWAIIHVHEADEDGNARIYGNRAFDFEMTRAAKGVIITAEDIFPVGHFSEEPELTVVPGFMVQAVVHVPGGAGPCSCHPIYGIGEAEMRRYMDLSQSADGLASYLESTDQDLASHAGQG